MVSWEKFSDCIKPGTLRSLVTWTSQMCCSNTSVSSLPATRFAISNHAALFLRSSLPPLRLRSSSSPRAATARRGAQGTLALLQPLLRPSSSVECKRMLSRQQPDLTCVVCLLLRNCSASWVLFAARDWSVRGKRRSSTYGAMTPYALIRSTTTGIWTVCMCVRSCSSCVEKSKTTAVFFLRSAITSSAPAARFDDYLVRGPCSRVKWTFLGRFRSTLLYLAHVYIYICTCGLICLLIDETQTRWDFQVGLFVALKCFVFISLPLGFVFVLVPFYLKMFETT